jgi:hypothetical protein
MTELVLCPACKRHVRTTEEICPFCSAAVPLDVRQAPQPPPLPRGLSRARVFALNAALATGVATAAAGMACENTSTSADGSAGAGGSAVGGDAGQAPGGASGSGGGTGGAGTGGTGSGGTGGVQPRPYGCVFPCDTAEG